VATATSCSTAVHAFAAQPCLRTDRQEAAIRAISLDWVVVRPATLTNEPARGSVRAITDLAGVQGGKTARADVARFVVEQLTTDTWLRRTPAILW
jgi:uncharacterized protein YbjT (DUF2867 family)